MQKLKYLIILLLTNVIPLIAVGGDAGKANKIKQQQLQQQIATQAAAKAANRNGGAANVAERESDPNANRAVSSTARNNSVKPKSPPGFSGEAPNPNQGPPQNSNQAPETDRPRPTLQRTKNSKNLTPRLQVTSSNKGVSRVYGAIPKDPERTHQPIPDQAELRAGAGTSHIFESIGQPPAPPVVYGRLPPTQ